MGLLDTSRVGFIGLGAMGDPMARRLVERLPANTQMTVFDVAPGAMDRLAEAHPGKIQKATSPREVAQNADLVISMVPEGRHVRSVYLEPETGIISHSDLTRHLLIDCSTIDTATSSAVSAELRKAFPSARFYDAPVSGGVLGAEKGSLAFFLGCSETDPLAGELVELLKTMGSQIISCGGPSLGLAAKLSNNYLSGLIAIASSEAMNMGMRSGLDPTILARAFAAGTAQNAICDRFNPVPGVVPTAPSSSGYKGGFKVQLMKKDFALAVDMANQVGARLALGPPGLETYEAASNDPRCRDLDSRVVFRYLGGNEQWQQNHQNGQAS